MPIWRTLGRTAVSTCYAPECPPYAHNRPEGARQSSPGQGRAERRSREAPPWVSGPQNVPSPNRGATRANASGVPNHLRLLEPCSPLAGSASSGLCSRENELARCFVAPRLGLGDYFLGLPRAARCRRDRRHRSALGSIVSARWAGRVAPSHMAKQNLRVPLEFSPSQGEAPAEPDRGDKHARACATSPSPND